MKIQTLAIILVIIILPISFALSIYTKSQVETLSLQRDYDRRLQNSTYDAIEAFQINEANSNTSDLANSKIRDIDASVNAFFNSLESEFELQGYGTEALREYVPALVYTMYDGYYIYSPYSNVATTSDEGVKIDPNETENIEYGLKPYVSYSCRYVDGSNNDFVITYSLDNYIDIKGIINGNYVSDSGYILSNVEKETEETYKYDGITIDAEIYPMKEYLGETIYPYIKLKGTKYYLDETNHAVFYILNGKRLNQATQTANPEEYEKYAKAIRGNSVALKYYKDAFDFTDRVLNEYGLKDLQVSNAVDINNNPINFSNTARQNIFKADPGSEEVPFEYENSNFNIHREQVIRYAIESNLSVAIANFNRYTQNDTFDYQMPVLSETDWKLLADNISIVSFLQGLNIGGKVYNGYSVVANTETENLVREEDICIVENYSSGSDYYHRVEDSTLNLNVNSKGVLYLDFKSRTVNSIDNTKVIYYFPRNELACYNCMVSQIGINNTSYENMYEYLSALENNTNNNLLKKIYYTALGRERYGIGIRNIGIDEL